MAGPGEIERAVAGSGEVDRAVAVSSEVERAMAGSGKDELSPLHSLDYPCTARLRRRRLFASLRWYSWELYQAAKMIMPVIFHTKDLVKKVQEGQWQEARCYIDRFAPFINSGYEAKLLMLFLHDFMILNGFADGRAMPRSCLWDWLNSIYQKPVLDKYPCFATLVDDVLSKRNDHARAFLDWQLVRNKAAKVAKEVAYKTPELRERMHYPCGRSDLYHVVPVGSRCRVKKNFSRKQSTDLAQYYLQMNKRLPSSTQGRNHSDPDLRGEPLLALFETSLKAGRRPEEGVPFNEQDQLNEFRITQT
ncbi:hypothetical protein QOZ80_4AG0304770 [Eleusine coracana subsp. coracana]|nr:hypothetical protein QOZ80_4AG0304770 [Eleusine coracana subsp. coracana]